ncbi:MAG: terminase small subunit [Sneathiella sp.]
MAKAKKKLKEIEPKQIRFADEWLVHRNMAKAARLSGYSERSAAQIGFDLFNLPHVKAYINERLEDLKKRTNVQQEDVIKGLLYVADLDPADLFDSKGNMLPVKDLPPEVRRAIAGFDITTTTVKTIGKDNENDTEETVQTAKIRFNDRMKGLESLGRTIAMFTDKQEIGGTEGGHPVNINFIPVGPKKK